MDISDQVFAKFLGQAIRRTRESRGWTRLQLAAKLPSGLGERTLLSYEHGLRQVTAVRLVEICRVLGVPGSEVLRRAEDAAADLTLHALTVNLPAVTKHQRDGFEAVATWATRRLSTGDGPHVRLDPASIREMAAVLGLGHGELAAYLADFAVDGQREAAPDHGSGGAARRPARKRTGPEPTTRLRRPPPPPLVDDDEEEK